MWFGGPGQGLGPPGLGLGLGGPGLGLVLGLEEPRPALQKLRTQISVGCRCNMEIYYANMPLFDIVVCVQLHINIFMNSVQNIPEVYTPS